MSVVSGTTGKLVYRQRMDTIKASVGALKREGVLAAVRNQVEGFGRNNRTLTRNFVGIPT